GAYDKQAKRLATDVEQLCVDNQAESASDDVRQVDVLPVPRPAPAGCAGVLVELKQHLGMLTGDTKSSTTVIEPDRFALHDDSPLRHEHELLSALFEEVIGTSEYHKPDFKALQAGQVILALKPPAIGKALLAAAERCVNALLNPSVNY